MGLFSKYTCIKQHDEKDCGAACFATISKHYGLNIPISKIREIAGTDLLGTSIYGLVKVAENLGFTSKAVKAKSTEDILSDFPKPAIAHIMGDNYMPHYVVVYKVDEKQIIISDPAKGICTLTIEEFKKNWTGILVLLVPSPSFQKGDETTGMFSRFFSLIRTQKQLILNVFVSSILITMLGIVGSFYFKFLLDDILPNRLSESLATISIAMAGLAVFRIIAEYFRSKLLIYMSQNIDIPLLLGYYNHVINLPMNFFGTRKVGEIISRFNDATKIREAISSATLTLMIDFFLAIAGGTILYSQNGKMFFVTLIPVLIYLVLVFVFRKIIDKVNNEVMEDNAKLTSYLVESLNGIELIKSLNGETRVNFETEKRFVRFIRSVFKYSTVNNLHNSLKKCVKALFAVVIMWIGAHYVLQGDMTIGSLIAFNSLLVYFTEPVERMIDLQPTIQSAIVAAERLSEILDLDLEKSSEEYKKIRPQSLNGEIKLKNVNFRYGTRYLTLKNINMEIGAGDKVALVGESGSGKTTIAKLLMNFYVCEDGEILINDYNIQDINRETLREKVSYISQEPFFFSGTIMDNLQFANNDASYEDIIEVCKKAQIHEFINSLPLRYDSLLEENASNISGGQRQRLAIARALLCRPDILIMDEATSNLDSITEKAIERTIEENSCDITTIIIAHRLSTIMRCNKIFVMDKGQIIESGNHEVLIKQKGRYFDLWHEQAPHFYSNEAAAAKENNGQND